MRPKVMIKAAQFGTQTPGTPYQDEDGTWRIDHVPMVSTGIGYKTAKGKVTFTEEDLIDAVKAVDDAAIVQPRIKLGHSSKYNEVLVGDAEQAFGRWDNLTLEDNNQTIYGDMVGMPEWLASVAPIAYPNRSIEGSFDGIETVTGNEYKMAISACGLLGVRWPGCSVLEDLPLWYGTEIPEGVEIEVADLIAASGGKVKLFKNKTELEAAVDVALIRRKFYNDGPGAENWGWWIRGERFDSSEGYNIIVDMGDGNLCRFPVSVDGSDITFGEYTLVTEEYPDKAMAASAVLAGMAMADPEMVIYASRADTESDRPDNTTQEGGALNEETRKKLAASVGLPEDATEAQINEKLQETAIAAADASGDEPAATTATATSGNTGTEGQPLTPVTDNPEDQTVTAHEAVGGATAELGKEPAELGKEPVIEAGVVQLDPETYRSLKANSDLAAKHEEERTTTRAHAKVEAAIEAGQIPVARREHYRKLALADFEGTAALLDSLEKDAVPMTARGTGGGEPEGIQAGEGEALPLAWFPEIAANRAAAEARRPVLQAQEG
jgi:hypothetical protein